MKIALLTIWHIGNYGAEMQTYATVRALKLLGHDVRVVDYRLNESNEKAHYIKSLIKNMCPASIKFNRFWRKHIPSTNHILNFKDLWDSVNDCDVFLVGSDQVWNPEITRNKALEFFLSFVPNGKRRLSYASSIGVSSWTAESSLTRLISNELERFERISCRERDGIKILNDTFKVSAEYVLDPTMLFEGYPELTGQPSSKNTLVYYPLFGGVEMESFSKELAHLLGLEFLNNNPISTWLGGRTWNRLSIVDWIRNFAESKFIVTQSYHGTVFSILYKKPFITIYSGKKISRISNLLEELGIQDRLFSTVEDARLARPWDIPIDYDKVYRELSHMRKKSWDYLTKI